MSGIWNGGKDPSRGGGGRGISEASLKLDPEAVAMHPGVLK